MNLKHCWNTEVCIYTIAVVCQVHIVYGFNHGRVINHRKIDVQGWKRIVQYVQPISVQLKRNVQHIQAVF